MSKKDQSPRQDRDEAADARQPKPPFKEQHQNSPGLESKLDPQPDFRAEAYRPAGKLKDKVALITGGDSGIGRPAQPEELALAYVFLASNADSPYITGTVLQVMGGETTGG